MAIQCKDRKNKAQKAEQRLKEDPKKQLNSRDALKKAGAHAAKPPVLKQGKEQEKAKDTHSPTVDGELDQSILVGGIQPGFDDWYKYAPNSTNNFLARQFYLGNLPKWMGGPQTQGHGKVALPYDDTGTMDEDIKRVERYGNYALGKLSWEKLVEEDCQGAQNIENLANEFQGIIEQKGIIYAHSGGGAATVAALTYMLDNNFKFDPKKPVHVEGLEAVITTGQRNILAGRFEELGITFVINNTIARTEDGKDGSEIWNDLIVTKMKENEDTPWITHQFNEAGDHTSMVTDMYNGKAAKGKSKGNKAGNLPSRSTYTSKETKASAQ